MRKWDKFVKETLVPEIRKRYLEYRILNEASLQSNVWQLLNDFFSQDEWSKNNIRVVCEPYLKELGMHPDIMIFRKRKPWMIIELKEWKVPKEKSAQKEGTRIKSVTKHFNEKYCHCLKGGHLLFVSRKISKEQQNILNKMDSKLFSIIPVALQIEKKDEKRFGKWENGFRQWSKYTEKPRIIKHHFS